MSLLQKISADKKPAQEKIFIPKPVESAPAVEIDHLAGTCLDCGSEDRWLPVGSTEDRCCRCQPPPAESLVGFRFFWFSGDRWVVWSDGGREVWTLEREWARGSSAAVWPDIKPKAIKRRSEA
jgi:hypothetical protein